MCVAIYKPAGVKVDKGTLLACFQTNPDGAGFAWFDGKEIHLSKGYFVFEDWARQIDKIPLDAPAMLHARITTHGETSPANCHPFIISSNPKLLEAQDAEVGKGLVAMHNGMIHGLAPVNSVDAKHSDTMHFIAQYLASLTKKVNILDGLGKKVVEKSIDGSKFAIMQADNGRVVLYGGWTKDSETGAYFSNMLWRNYRHDERKYAWTVDEEYYERHYGNYRQMTWYEEELGGDEK